MRPLVSTFPVLTLTLLQFGYGKAIRFVVGLALIPILFSLIYILDDSTDTAREFFNQILQNVIFPTILPLAALILATTALGDEIEDRTMVYLVLKPISRLRIVVEKYTAVVQTAVAALWVGLILTWLVTARGEAFDSADMLVAAAIAALVGVVGYGALFLALSLIIPRTLIVGIVYILIWESFLSRLIPGASLLSIRNYIISIYYRVLDDPFVELVSDAEPMRFFSALAVTLLILAGSIGFATLRLKTMDLE
jgi:ABC-2 type transport system permease protein